MGLKREKKLIKVLATFLCFVFMISAVPTTILAEEVNKVTQETVTKVGETYSGFKLISEKPLPNERIMVKTFEHEKSGAKVTYFENDDENKIFSVGFRTPTSDNSGANHILEHSVLCGSEKFPVKNLLSKVSKSARTLYLNALTFDDRTVYPFATRYDKDFKELMDIYLDAVLNPNVKKEKNIFKREGWRYELNSRDDELKINGIVYNEMKGSYSDPQVILNREIYKSVFPDTMYKNEAGGYPDDIPTLTYEQLKETHDRYYKPSNADIFLYGKLDILETLKFIDNKYLSKFNKEEVNSNIDLQKSLSKRAEVTANYSITKGSNTENKSIMALNFVIDTIKDRESYFAINSMSNILLYSPKAPLEKALRGVGFKGELSVEVRAILQPVLSIVLKNINEKDKSKFEKVITDTLNNMVKEGVDKENIESLLKAEDKRVDANKYSKYTESSHDFLCYDLDPTEYLDQTDIKKSIKKKIDSGEKYFEKYIEEKILKNTHSSLIILNPKQGLDEESNLILKNKLQEYKNSLSQEQIDNLIRETKDFREWQDTPDSEEAMNTLPKSETIQDDREDKEYERYEKKIDGVKTFYNPCENSEKAYLSTYINLKNIPQDKMNYLKLYMALIGNIDLKDCSKEDFEKICDDEEIFFLPMPMICPKNDTAEEFTSTLGLVGMFDLSKVDKGISILNNMLMDINLNDKENIEKVIDDSILSLDGDSINDASEVPMQSISSTFSKAHMYNSMDVNNSFLLFLKNLRDNFDKEWGNTVKQIEEVEKTIYNKDNIMINIVCNDETMSKFEQGLTTFTNKLGDKPFVEQKYNLKPTEKRMAYVNNEKVVYVAKGDNINKFGYKYNGTMKVTELIISEYLFNTIRMQGGAYGANFTIDTNGTAMMNSYRDTNIKQTLDYFDSSAEYLKSLKISQGELDKYISLAVSKVDQELDLLSDPTFLTIKSGLDYVTDTDINYLSNLRKEIIATKIEDINNFGYILEKVLGENNYSVSGNKEKIEENRELFSKIMDLSNKEEDIKLNRIRIEGKDRYKTALNITKEGWKEADTAILCYGEDFPDALSAVPLSKKYDAPILLTKTKELDKDTKQTLKDLKVKNVFIIGREGVVSKNIAKEIESQGMKTERLGGKNRYDTSLKIAQKLGDVKGVVVTTGREFAPGLSISTYAANNNMPVILVDDDDMSKDLVKYLQSRKFEEVYYATNERHVGKKVMKVLPGGKRISEKDMYSNNIAILKTFDKHLDKNNVFVATGKNFADALCGAALAAKMKAPLVFMNNKVESSTSEYLKSTCSHAKNMYIMGSEGAVDSKTLEDHLK